MSPPIELLLLVPPLLFALTFHEAAHAWTALRLGDPTAKLLGRLTLNPLVHLDPIGTIVFFIARIGWAKPVPVDVRYLRHPRRDMMWIALAGPASNVLLAFGFGLALRAIDALGVSPTSAPMITRFHATGAMAGTLNTTTSRITTNAKIAIPATCSIRGQTPN